METVLNLYKPQGKLPIQTIEDFRERYPEYAEVKLGYAGRLDPLAHGVLLVLVGDENKNKKEYENLEKEYEFELLFGLNTDTYDVMGLIENDSITEIPSNLKSSIINTLPAFLGESEQPYPPFSAIRVHGKPLLHYAITNMLSTIKIPVKKITIFSLDFLKEYELSAPEVKESVFSKIANVRGDFRQAEIIKRWDDVLLLNPNAVFKIARLKAVVSSGTYVRSIAFNLGKKLGTGAIAFEIKRTRVGSYLLENSLRVD